MLQGGKSGGANVIWEAENLQNPQNTGGKVLSMSIEKICIMEIPS